MKTITKEDLKKLRAELDAALPDIAEKLGMKLKVGNGSYDATTATFKIEAAMLDESGKAQTKEARYFELYCEQFGLHKDDLNKTFATPTGGFQVIGILPRSYKFPILVKEISTNKEYKYPAEFVKNKLHPTPKVATPAPKLVQNQI